MKFLEKAILQQIKTEGFITCVGLENLFEMYGVDYEGDCAWMVVGQTNVNYWGGWNDEALDFVWEVMSENDIKLDGNDGYQKYLLEGKGLNLALVNPLISVEFIETHPEIEFWLPIVLVHSEGKVE